MDIRITLPAMGWAAIYNNGGANSDRTFRFLKIHRKFMHHMRFDGENTVLAIETNRLPCFIEHARKHGLIAGLA